MTHKGLRGPTLLPQELGTRSSANVRSSSDDQGDALEMQYILKGLLEQKQQWDSVNNTPY